MTTIRRDPDAIKKLVAGYSVWWRKDAQKAIALLYKELEKGAGIDKAIKTVELEYPQVFKLPNMEGTLVKAAAYGYGIIPSVMTKADEKAVGRDVAKAWTGDKLTLSQKLHGASKKMHRAIVATLRQQIKANNTWLAAARALYDGYGYGKVIKSQQIADYMRLVRKASGVSETLAASRKALYNINRLAQNGAPTKALKAAYMELVAAAEKGSQKALKRAVNVAIAEKSRYVAERIARTESAKAWADGFLARTLFDEDIIGYKWRLSSNHPRFDICDMYARTDMFGLGEGVYPKDKIPPLPAHPHCRCEYMEVFKTEIDLDAERDQIKAEGEKWLRDLPIDKQEAVLGVQGREEWLNGKDWRELMRGWQGLIAPESRLTPSIFADILKEEYLPKTLSFADGYIPQYSVITDVTAIAGKESRTTLRAASYYAERYGGNPEDWQKMAGKVTSDKYVFDIHWMQNEDIGKIKHFVKFYRERG